MAVSAAIDQTLAGEDWVCMDHGDRWVAVKTAIREALMKVAQDRGLSGLKAKVANKSALLNPGMTGIAKVDAGQRPLAWIWFHRVYHWFGLWLWRI